MRQAEPFLGFWKDLPRPIFSLAPMEHISDALFRSVLCYIARPAVFFTEFVQVDRLLEGDKAAFSRLRYARIQKPIVAQLWGSEPEKFYESVKIIKELDFDGVDINMGCSRQSVRVKKAGAGLIRHPGLAKEILEAVSESAFEETACEKKIPWSVKTRLGWEGEELEEWLGHILPAKPSVLSLHARTALDTYAKPASWASFRKAREILEKNSPNTLLFANGDICSLENARELLHLYQLDGLMIGREAFKNPGIFGKLSVLKNLQSFDVSESKKQLAGLEVLFLHTLLYDKYLGTDENFRSMRKFYKAYLAGQEETEDLEAFLLKCDQAKELMDYLETKYDINRKALQAWVETFAFMPNPAKS